MDDQRQDQSDRDERPGHARETSTHRSKTSGDILNFPGTQHRDAQTAGSATNTQATREVDPYIVEALKPRTPLLVALQQHHRIEHAADWREYCRRYEGDVQTLFDDGECIIGCRRTDRAPFKANKRDRNLAYEYQFEKDQAVKSLPEKVVVKDNETDARNATCYEVVVAASNIEAGLICLKSSEPLQDEVDLVYRTYISTKEIEGAV